MSKAPWRNKSGGNIPQRRVSFERVQCVRLTSNLDRRVSLSLRNYQAEEQTVELGTTLMQYETNRKRNGGVSYHEMFL